MPTETTPHPSAPPTPPRWVRPAARRRAGSTRGVGGGLLLAVALTLGAKSLGGPRPAAAAAPRASGEVDPLAALAERPKLPPAQAVRLHVVVRDALERALATADPQCGRALAAEVARLLRWRGDLPRRARRHDTLTLLYVPHPKPVEPELLALHYEGELLELRAYRFAAAGDGIARYYDQRAHRVEPTMRAPPVPSYWQITETVQRGRGRRRHKGDDFRAPEGSPVVLSFPGRVTRTNWARRHNGRCIEVQLDNGYLAHYLHLQVLAPEVRPGVTLPAGAILGTVGNTGRSTGAHLHYELLRHGQPIEPLKFHGTTQEQLSGEDLAAFVGWRDGLEARLGAAPVRGGSQPSTQALRQN